MPHHIKIKISKVLIPFTVSRQVPCNWMELSPKQLQSIALATMAGASPLQIFLILTRMPLWLFNLIPADVQEQLVSLVSWSQAFPTATNIGIEGYNNTGEGFEHCTVAQFAWADLYFFNIANGRDIERNLAKLIACLYVPSGQTFKIDHIKNFERFAKLSIDQQHAILLFFRGCRNKMVRDYKEIFEGTPSQGSTDKQEAKADPETMFHLINELSKTGQYGTFAQTSNTPLLSILHNKRLDLKFNKPTA